MSMMGHFMQVSPDLLKQMIDDPSSVEGILGGEQVTQGAPQMMENLTKTLASRAPQILAASMGSMDPATRERLTKALSDVGVDLEALGRGEGAETLAKLLSQRAQTLMGQTKNQPPASGDAPQSSGKGASISLDKAWHGVHYLLCGKLEPGSDLASQAVMGGTEIGDDVGYGPARYFDAGRVAAIAAELSRPNLEAQMTARFDPDQMANLGIYPGQFVPGEDDTWLMDEFRKLRQFYVDASAAKLAVVTWLD